MYIVKMSKRDTESENSKLRLRELKMYLTINHKRAAVESVKQTGIESRLLLVVCIHISLSSGCILIAFDMIIF